MAADNSAGYDHFRALPLIARTAKDDHYFIRAYEIMSPPAPEIVR